MAITSVTKDYVKFVRMTPTIWDSLDSSQKHLDTLYFVLIEGATEGSLYLGNTLIATSIDTGLSLSQLNDVLVGSGLKNNDVLIYQSDAKQWMNMPISDFQPGVMIGATADKEGVGGLVPAPEVAHRNSYLRGDGQWADPTAELSQTVETLSDTVGTINGALKTVIGPDTGKSMRDVAGEIASVAVAQVIADAPEAFNTLKEIADWIQGTDDPGIDAADIIADVAQLKSDIYGTEDAPGLATTVETLSTNLGDLTDAYTQLNNYVRGPGNENSLQAITTAHTALLEQHASNIQTNADAITAIDARLKWTIMEETV